jgi:hypothetical protein
MRIQLIHGVLGEDYKPWGAGDVRDASEGFARWLIARKKAKPAPEVGRRAEPPAVVADAAQAEADDSRSDYAVRSPAAAEQAVAAPRKSTGRAGRHRGGK